MANKMLKHGQYYFFGNSNQQEEQWISFFFP
jgi:hypothetical protein